jgi:hypothetical protein
MPEQNPKTNEDTYSPRAVLLSLAVILVLVLGGPDELRPGRGDRTQQLGIS